MLTLYPEIKPNAQHRIAVDPPHELYVEESGTRTGYLSWWSTAAPVAAVKTTIGAFSTLRDSGSF